MADTYIYIVRMESDDNDWGWEQIVPTKREAMIRGRVVASDQGKKLVYLGYGEEKSYVDYDCKEYVVVEQAKEYYHGA